MVGMTIAEAVKRFGLLVVMTVINLTWIISGFFVGPRPLWVVFPLSLILGGTHGAVIHNTLKEQARGRNRRAEASASDPGTGEGTFTTGGPVSTDRSAEGPRHDLEVVESDMPILAHRIAGLKFDGTSYPFMSLNPSQFGARQFGVDADAYCTAREHSYYSLSHRFTEPPPHGPVPSVDCTCGYYAVPSDIEPWGEGTQYVTLLVELSGTVIEHETGYRAQHQRVIECRIPACPLCKRQASHVLINDRAMTSTVCEVHLPQVTADLIVTAEDAAHVIGVPVTYQGRAS